jgi:hypothetical protein
MPNIFVDVEYNKKKIDNIHILIPDPESTSKTKCKSTHKEKGGSCIMINEVLPPYQNSIKIVAVDFSYNFDHLSYSKNYRNCVKG